MLPCSGIVQALYTLRKELDPILSIGWKCQLKTGVSLIVKANRPKASTKASVFFDLILSSSYRDEAGCVRRRAGGAPAGREGSGDQRGGRADREKTQLQDGTETPASPRQADRRGWGRGCRLGGDRRETEKTEQ